MESPTVTPAKRKNTASDRACDQCKLRKIKCDMTKPCTVCEERGFNCTYEKANKKRGPSGKRIKEIMEQQGGQRAVVSGESVSRDVMGGAGYETHGGANGDVLLEHLERTNSTSSLPEPEPTQYSPQMPYWPSNSMQSQHTNGNSTSHGAALPPLQQVPTSATTFSATSQPFFSETADSPNASEFIFPSLPVESPSSSWDPFSAILDQDLPPLTARLDIWPSHINEETLLPWIDVYFKRLHPTIPILSRTTLYQEMLLRKQHTDQQFGAMLLSLCAFAMTQPVQIHERASAPSRTAQARMLMEECVKMRVAADFGENPCIEMVLTSFFLFGCLFGSSQHKAARLRLSEAVDLGHSLGVHLPQSYKNIDAEVREQWLRTYLVLSVTERAYALQQRHSIDFRGRPGITARFMQAFDPTDATAFISSLIYQDQADSVGMTGLLYLMDAFDSFDGSVIECWIGYCNYSDGVCDSFDRRRAMQMFKALYRAREASMDGNLSLAPSASPLPLTQLLETQQADISITQLWLLNRLWNLSLSHGLVRETSDYPELEFVFACRIARAMVDTCRTLSLASMEVHGVGFVEKIYNAAADVLEALKASSRITLDMRVPLLDEYSFQMPKRRNDGDPTLKMLLQSLQGLLQDFRGGDHPYRAPFNVALSEIVTD